MQTQRACTDCGSLSYIECCTVCRLPVCPAHRSGSGRLSDGYQCKERDCWFLGYPKARQLLGLPAAANQSVEGLDMKWFDGRFNIARQEVALVCSYCGKAEHATLETYQAPPWPTPAVWCQPPKGWALMLSPPPQGPPVAAEKVLGRCGDCAPKPPPGIVLHAEYERAKDATEE